MGFFKKKIIDEDILGIIEHKNLLQRYIYLVSGLFIEAFAYNVFILKYNLVYGGGGGIAILVQNYLDPSVTLVIISIVALILSYMFLGKDFAVNSIVGSALFPIFVKLTEDFTISVPSDDIMLIVICGAVLTGFGNGITTKTGFSTGGVDSIVHILSKKLKISFGKAFSLLNGAIVLLSGYVYGWRIILYALIILYIMNIITDKVVLGISENKTFFIVTHEEERIRRYLIGNLSTGITVLDAHGGYTNSRTNVIMVVIPSSEYFKAREGILEIDPNAFLTICDSYQVYGAFTRVGKGGNK